MKPYRPPPPQALREESIAEIIRLLDGGLPATIYEVEIARGADHAHTFTEALARWRGGRKEQRP